MIGLSRTGTKSLTELLRSAGLKVEHNPGTRDLLAGRYDAATDIPAAAHFRMLDKLFPGSLFILTVRNEEDWLASVVPFLRRKRHVRLQNRINRLLVYGRLFPDEDQAKRSYRKHLSRVYKYFSRKTNLFVLNLPLEQSTERLQRFLDFIELPNDIPHTRFRKDHHYH